tara:strand:+ start:493 stop:1380 length:888 start_codon:yes stop_codon:yes gene_type:complete
MNWTTENLKDQSGKLFVITGANTGLGYEMALELAKKSAYVVMTGRNENKLQEAKAEILKRVPGATLELGLMDLSDISSIKNFAKVFKSKHEKLDVLINNAGIMFPPPGRTKDGFELEFGVNYIGHYVLTALLFPLLKKTAKSRIVSMSSIAHLNGRVDFENLKLEKPFDKFREYGQSKVADLIFSLELQRRIEKRKLDIISVAAHPGISKTELLRTDSPEKINEFPHMSAKQGAFSALYAATEPIEGGSYIGPDGEGEMTGYPAPAFISEYAQDPELGTQLWGYTEQETGVLFDF